MQIHTHDPLSLFLDNQLVYYILSIVLPHLSDLYDGVEVLLNHNLFKILELPSNAYTV